ncbi:MAG: s-methyl-5-thioribose-1-phosphate isomerase [Candidatus Bathyarchaeia archaeon]
MMPRSKLESILAKLGMVFDGELGTYVHKSTNIPLSILYDEKTRRVKAIDQTKLPYELSIWETDDWREILTAIRSMVIRGAPLIGCAGAFALLLAAKDLESKKPNDLLGGLRKASRMVVYGRPTGVDAENIAGRIVKAAESVYLQGLGSHDIVDKVEEEVQSFFVENLLLNKALRDQGARFFHEEDVVLTHCEAGSLATSYGGSALGIIAEVAVANPSIMVVVKETRPRCQGYKLATWELSRAGIPVVSVTDNMVSSSIERYHVTKAIVGADRITRDGCVTNKIGTHDLALICSSYHVPFYVAAPCSTLDLKRERGEIPIEERDPSEVSNFYRYEALYMKSRGLLSPDALDRWPTSIAEGKELPSRGEIGIFNPAFDVTPPDLVSKVILDIGAYDPRKLGELGEDDVRARAKKTVGRYLRLFGEG